MKTLFLCVVLVLSMQTADAQPFNPNLAAKLQQTLDTQLASFPDTKGVSASVYYPGQGVWKGASGISFPGNPITTDMEFGIASNTKLFTAVAIMKLVQGKILSLDDQLRRWLPTYANIDSTITIRQLLNHTSGIADVFTTSSMAYLEANPAHLFTIAELMGYVGTKLFKPGTSFGYSNTNYILTGMIAESATGHHISKVIRDSILIPLQLDSTFFAGSEPVQGTIAHPWQNGVDGFSISRVALHSFGLAAGALYSTASEMAQWYQALLSGRVLSDSSLAQVTSFLSPGNYGFGFSTLQLFGRSLWGHGGTTNGYKSRMFYDPLLKTTVCGLSNSSQSAIDGAITGILLKTIVDLVPGPAGTITGTQTICQNQTAVFTVDTIPHATAYTWTLPRGTVGTISGNRAIVTFDSTAVSGIISVKGSNLYGDGLPSSFSVIVNPLPGTAGRVSGTSTVCQGENSIVYSVPPISSSTSYEWTLPKGAKGSSSTNTITVGYDTSASSGSITVRGKNTCGYGQMETFSVVVNPKPSTPVVSVMGNVLRSSAPLGNQWYNQNGIIEGATGQNHTVLVDGEYYVIVTLLGCTSDSSRRVPGVTTGVESPDVAHSIRLYPNPTANDVTIELPGNSTAIRYELVNLTGRVVSSGSVTSKTIIPMQSLPPGVYLIHFEDGETIKFEKMPR